jgi:hypothetical protein
MLAEAIRTGSQPPERRLITPESVPSLQELARKSDPAKMHRSVGV